MYMADVRVRVDGREVSFPDPSQRPVLNNDRITLPLRAIFNALGVNNNEITFTPGQGNTAAIARVNYGRYTLFIVENSTSFFRTDNVARDPVNINFDRGVDRTPVPAQIINGRFMVPLRRMLESVGCTVDWEPRSRMVVVETVGGSAANVFAIATTNALATDNPKQLMDLQLEHLIWECQPTLHPDYRQWWPNSTQRYYDRLSLTAGTPGQMTFAEFIASTHSVRDLTLIYHATRLRSGDTAATLQQRINYANEWYAHFNNRD
jgi:hypothetical protein